MIDLHCHILPGIDDGASDIESAIAMAQLAVSCGITTIVATPHHLPGIYPTTAESVLETLSLLTTEIRAREIPLQILPGQEIYIEPQTLEKILNRSLLTINFTNYFLLELPFSQIPERAQEMVFRAGISGFTPILAHPERNIQIQQNPEIIANFTQSGALIQITGSSLVGRQGQETQKTARELLQRELVHVIASDAHTGESGIRDFLQASEYVSSFYGDEVADRLTGLNPQAIISGEKIPPQ
jgi:protein-tyrosine phosphatase